MKRIEDTTTYTLVDTMPIYRGCEHEINRAAIDMCTKNKMVAQIVKNVRYPQELKNKGISGEILVSYSIDQKGKVTNIKIKRGIPNGEELERSVIRAVSKLKRMKPAIQSGKKVIIEYTIPIRFNLTQIYW